MIVEKPTSALTGSRFRGVESGRVMRLLETWWGGMKPVRAFCEEDGRETKFTPGFEVWEFLGGPDVSPWVPWAVGQRRRGPIYGDETQGPTDNNLLRESETYVLTRKRSGMVWETENDGWLVRESWPSVLLDAPPLSGGLTMTVVDEVAEFNEETMKKMEEVVAPPQTASHTTVFKDGVPGDESDVRIHHNSDWSGEAILHWHGGLMEVDSVSINGEHRIPGWVARELCRALIEGDNEPR